MAAIGSWHYGSHALAREHPGIRLVSFSFFGSMSGLNDVIPLNGLQVSEAADGQPLFILLAPIDHSVNMLCENLFCLHYHRWITRL